MSTAAKVHTSHTTTPAHIAHEEALLLHALVRDITNDRLRAQHTDLFSALKSNLTNIIQ